MELAAELMEVTVAEAELENVVGAAEVVAAEAVVVVAVEESF